LNTLLLSKTITSLQCILKVAQFSEGFVRKDAELHAIREGLPMNDEHEIARLTKGESERIGFGLARQLATPSGCLADAKRTPGEADATYRVIPSFWSKNMVSLPDEAVSLWAVRGANWSATNLGVPLIRYAFLLSLLCQHYATLRLLQPQILLPLNFRSKSRKRAILMLRTLVRKRALLNIELKHSSILSQIKILSFFVFF